MSKILVYWQGIVGVPGKGPNWSEPYDPNKTIGQVIQAMEQYNLAGGKNKRIEIFKYDKTNINKWVATSYIKLDIS